MTLLEDILKEMCLLTEDANVTTINDAINGMHPVWIKYDDKQGGTGKNKRLICPVAYGISTAGNPVVRAYQTTGSTKRGTPKWKLFRVDRVVSWRNINSKKYNPDNLIGLNKEGDDQIETLYTIAPIGVAKKIAVDKNQVTGIKSTPITKNDIKDINIGKEPEANQTNYTANNAVNDIISNIQNNTTDNVDNLGKETYTSSNSKMEAPETEPVTKAQINTINTGNEENSDTKQIKQTETGDGPITKDELSMDNDVDKEEQEDNEKKENELSKSFKDIMSRMDNLNNKEDNKKEEENANQ